mgnify:CR=1 FL=1
MDSYSEKYQEKVLRVIAVAGGALHGINALTNSNIVTRLLGNTATRILFFVIALATMFVGMDRDFYLPFLGDSVFPNGLLASHVTPNGADSLVTATVPPHTKVVYWAAEPCYEDCEIPVMAWDAYKNYTNSGVATSDDTGLVKFMVRGPQAYNVPYKENTLAPHVHYRYVKHNGMFSKIYTAKIERTA